MWVKTKQKLDLHSSEWRESRTDLRYYQSLTQTGRYPGSECYQFCVDQKCTMLCCHSCVQSIIKISTSYVIVKKITLEVFLILKCKKLALLSMQFYVHASKEILVLFCNDSSKSSEKTRFLLTQKSSNNYQKLAHCKISTHYFSYIGS